MGGRFYSDIGYGTQVETSPGIWVDKITIVRKYSGNVIRNMSKMQGSENLNDDLNVNNQLSIVADAFAYENFSSMRYIKWLGTLWKITSVEVQRPRLILTIGGVYNEQT